MILVATVVTRIAMWLYATKRTHILLAPVDPRSRWAGVILVAFPGVAYLIAYLVAEPAPTLAIWIYALVPVLYFVTIWNLRASSAGGSVSEEFT